MATQPAAQTVTLADMPRVYTATVDGAKWWKFTIPSQTRTIYLSYAASYRDIFTLYWSLDQSLSHDDTITTSYATDGTVYNQFSRELRDSGTSELRAFPIHLNPLGRNSGKGLTTIDFFVGTSEDECISIAFGGM